ncbi:MULTISPECIES: DUF3500 domain-containing protein [unclassified Curtobacterium]|uniref:DUF3500 domain-containing protein n=1 Tax=unclassified Curtobacterium TaxID=257496 RepID=UPI00381BCBC8
MPAASEQDEFFSDERTTGRAGAVTMPSGSYREHVLDPADPVVAQYRGQRWDEYAADRTAPDFVQELLADWRRCYEQPFRGVTSDGSVRPGLFALEGRADTAAPSITEPVAAAMLLIGSIDGPTADALRYDFESPEWRAWSNPEFTVHRVGLRLEDCAEPVVDAILGLVDASLSPEGSARVRELMALNGLLGDLVELPTVMNDRSYWFALYGEPDPDAPWGWQLFGHHLAVHFVSVGGRHVIAPAFLGAEPAATDGDRVDAFGPRERAALRLASTFDERQRAEVVVYESVLDPSMPPGRLHPADERHVAGAFQDNRVVPYEGIRASGLDDEQTAALLEVVDDVLVLLRDDQRARTLAEFEDHLDETSVAWYGATDGSEPFYLRVHSPVLLTELDHHAGVWLGNQTPARFHVHTTLRHPNGGDYGHALVERWRVRQASLVDRDVPYGFGDTAMLGYLCAPAEPTVTPGPAVLLLHDAFGVNEDTRALARRYARLGYTVLAADIWGGRTTPVAGEEIGPLIGGMASNRPEWSARVRAALHRLVEEPSVDPDRIAVVGYCFGGASGLELLRRAHEAGVRDAEQHDVRAVISVHGGLDLVGDDWAESPAAPGTRVLLCTGAADPMATPEMVAAVERGLSAIGAEWETDTYGGAVHAFTSVHASLAGPPDVAAHHPRAAARARVATEHFLAEALAAE